MKKLYRKGAVHPIVSDNLLSFLPAAILTLTVALSPEEKEVLAYLISCSSANSSCKKKNSASKKTGAEHLPSFNCNCFRCYMSYWIKWDSSPNRQLIHEVIDAFEDSLLKESKKEKSKKQRRKGKMVKSETNLGLDELKSLELSLTNNNELSFTESNSAAEVAVEAADEVVVKEENVDEEGLEKGSVRRFVSFVGEKIWSVWG